MSTQHTKTYGMPQKQFHERSLQQLTFKLRNRVISNKQCNFLHLKRLDKEQTNPKVSTGKERQGQKSMKQRPEKQYEGLMKLRAVFLKFHHLLIISLSFFQFISIYIFYFFVDTFYFSISFKSVRDGLLQNFL